MTEPYAVHKNTGGPLTYCGMYWVGDAKTSPHWKKVTCKRCLKKDGRL